MHNLDMVCLGIPMGALLPHLTQGILEEEGGVLALE